ncbi:MAG: FtsQ-type POTRA domain-containing protein [Anaerolineae bacterium]|nr:FtsQ-type POTRA domain-containing protein [Anaerolineae bacterium]
MRPVGSAAISGPATRGLQRMQPRSQALPAGSSQPSLRQRRAERRVRRSGEGVARRRRVSIWQVLNWRVVSALLVLGFGFVLYLFLSLEAFYVSSVAIGGEKFVTREEIFRYSDVARQHVFWIDPAEVTERLEQVPNIADATVLVGWPPNAVQIIVVEREPALIWEQQIRVWVDVNGIVMMQREDIEGLLRIVVPDAAEPISVGQQIPQTVVEGALALRYRYPNIDVLLYDSMKGLGYHDGRGWTVWFGTGEDMDTKLRVYNALVAEIVSQVQPGEIIMSDPDRPYYTVLWRNS